jgi:hypothetical protein
MIVAAANLHLESRLVNDEKRGKGGKPPFAFIVSLT